jgi:hypothetical protein
MRLILRMFGIKMKQEGSRMESSGSRRSGLLTAGGVLSIVAGVLEVMGGGIAVALVMSPGLRDILLPPPPTPWKPPGWYDPFEPPISTWFVAVGVALLVLGIIAIAGGVSALKRKSFGLSLAGAICAYPLPVLGFLAAISVALRKREFVAEK